MVRIGFVPLIDAAPIIVAQETGLFAAEGVRVALERQVGWANIRDKLTYGHLDVSHALLGMPLASAAGIDWFAEPLVSIMALGSGGNAITLSRRLTERGVTSSAMLARWIREAQRDRADSAAARITFAHVFSCSTHHYLLREWLAAAEINPDEQVRLCVLPPPQMAEHMGQGHLDGFCVGEPWNTLAQRRGIGQVVTPTTDIVPEHPEKVLAVKRDWVAHHGATAVALVRALLRACAYCDDEKNIPALADILCLPRYLDVPRDVVVASLKVDRSIGVSSRHLSSRSPDWRMRSFAPEGMFPSATHSAWIAEQMIRWGHADASMDVMAVARSCTDSRHYRRAAESLGLTCPESDFAPMPLRHGWYDPERSPYTGAARTTATEAEPAPAVPAFIESEPE